MDSILDSSSRDNLDYFIGTLQKLLKYFYNFEQMMRIKNEPASSIRLERYICAAALHPLVKNFDFLPAGVSNNRMWEVFAETAKRYVVQFVSSDTFPPANNSSGVHPLTHVAQLSFKGSVWEQFAPKTSTNGASQREGALAELQVELDTYKAKLVNLETSASYIPIGCSPDDFVQMFCLQRWWRDNKPVFRWLFMVSDTR